MDVPSVLRLNRHSVNKENIKATYILVGQSYTYRIILSEAVSEDETMESILLQ
jgi:hypothetical protein